MLRPAAGLGDDFVFLASIRIVLLGGWRERNASLLVEVALKCFEKWEWKGWSTKKVPVQRRCQDGRM